MKTWKVLLVDDEEEFASTLAERLRYRGITTSIASDGAEALELIEADPPEVVVLDVKMPGFGGLEVLKNLRRTNPQIKVILLTGYGSIKGGIEGMHLGAFEYLTKPVSIEKLIEKMAEALEAS